MEPPKKLKISAAILAGGMSRRFGSPKTDVLLDGRPLIRHVYEAVLPVADEIMVSLGAGAARPDLPGVLLVHDEYRGCGPLAGIHACLQTAAHPWLLVVAGDLPRIKADTLKRLIQACNPTSQIVMAGAAGGQAQPLCGCYHRTVLEGLEKALFEGSYGVMKFIDSVMKVTRINVSSEEMVNVNRPEDLPPADQTTPDPTIK